MRSENKMVVYLAGYIHNEVIDKCKEWRLQIRNHYEHWKGGNDPYPIIWLDPINGEENVKIKEEGLISSIPANAITQRDYQCISKSDLLIANMDTFGMSRPPIGTISEVAWAWEKRIPVIIISEDFSYTNHPFMKTFSSYFVSSVKELLEKKIINFFYKGWNNAIY